MLRKHRLFLEQGSSSLKEMINIKVRLSDLRSLVNKEFPLTQSQVEDMHDEIAGKVKAVRDIEIDAIDNLSKAINF